MLRCCYLNRTGDAFFDVFDGLYLASPGLGRRFCSASPGWACLASCPPEAVQLAQP
jgi:hypothetical protein